MPMTVMGGPGRCPTKSRGDVPWPSPTLPGSRRRLLLRRPGRCGAVRPPPSRLGDLDGQRPGDLVVLAMPPDLDHAEAAAAERNLVADLPVGDGEAVDAEVFAADV